MPLSQSLKEFGLDAESIARDREMSAGLAKGHQRAAREEGKDEERWFLHMMAAATEYRRAGAHSILLSDRETCAQMFEQAGRVYTRMRRPYALMMFWCAQEMDQVIAGGMEFGSLEEIDRSQLAYLLLASTADRETWKGESREALTQHLAGSQNSPIGVLGIPIGAYVDLAYTLERQEPSESSILEALLPFVLPYSTAVRRCMEDEYHWQRMAFPFHPAEPDVLSVLFCVESALRRRQQSSLLRILESIPLFPVATNLLYNSILERFDSTELPA
jgi:hypothetical protein